MDRANQGRHDGQQLGTVCERRFQGALRAGGRAGDKAHLDTGLLAQPQDSGHRIFLGSADDQPSDDVNDPHPA